jgi:hypothetical protein
VATKLGYFIVKSETSSKNVNVLLPLVDVAAVLVTNGNRILAVYNEKWGSFTLPMAKRRTWEGRPADKAGAHTEEWEDAAVRAAAEYLGRTLTSRPRPLVTLAEFQQSDRDGQWKRYHLRAFKLAVDPDTRPSPAVVAEWLTADDFTDEKRQPISPTARHIIAELKLQGAL